MPTTFLTEHNSVLILLPIVIRSASVQIHCYNRQLAFINLSSGFFTVGPQSIDESSQINMTVTYSLIIFRMVSTVIHLKFPGSQAGTSDPC